MPETAAAPDSRLVDIEIEDSELRRGPDRIHGHGGYVTLRVRSDVLLIVEVEGKRLSWPVLAGEAVLITLDMRSTKDLELELIRRKGGLVLRLSD